MDLMDNDRPDEVRFQLPVAIGCMRSGTSPAVADASAATAHTRLTITASIQMSEEIQRISTPGHPMAKVSAYRNHRGENSTHRSVVELRSPDFLKSDFVIVIRARGLDSPRCFAEQDDGRGTIALQLAVVPNFHIPPLPAQEYLFLIDRSGSMGQDGRIATAKDTLTVLLRQLPCDGTKFNIFSFGTECDSLWSGSMPYTQQMIDDAVSSLSPD